MSWKFDPNDADRGRERYPARRRDRYMYEQDGQTLKPRWTEYWNEGIETTVWKSKERRFKDGDWDQR